MIDAKPFRLGRELKLRLKTKQQQQQQQQQHSQQSHQQRQINMMQEYNSEGAPEVDVYKR